MPVCSPRLWSCYICQVSWGPSVVLQVAWPTKIWVKPEHCGPSLLVRSTLWTASSALVFLCFLYLVWTSLHTLKETVTNWQNNCVPQQNLCSNKYVFKNLNTSFNFDVWMGAKNQANICTHIGTHMGHIWACVLNTHESHTPRKY